jgi:hypothetical protein
MLGRAALVPVGRNWVGKQVAGRRFFALTKKNPCMRTHAVGAPLRLLEFRPLPSGRAEPLGALALGLDGVMRSARAHAIARIDRVAVVSAFLNVIGEEAVVLRR